VLFQIGETGGELTRKKTASDRSKLSRPFFIERELMREESLRHIAHDLFCRRFMNASPEIPRLKRA